MIGRGAPASALSSTAGPPPSQLPAWWTDMACSANASLRRGFTLIELLIAIAVISMLLAVLLPALSSARAEGAKAKCLGNMRSLGQSMATYSSDDPQNMTSPIHFRADCHWWCDGEYEYGGMTGQRVYGNAD